MSRVHGTGISGTGVRVGVIETQGGRTEQNSLLLRPVLQDPQNVCAAPNAHATNVTSVIAGRRINFFGTLVGDDGVAFGADVRVGGSCAGLTAENQTAATRAADWGARALNLSFGVTRSRPSGRRPLLRRDGPQPLAHHRQVGRQPRRGVHRRRPGDQPRPGYNVTTVGNFDDAGTAQWGDDTMSGCSSFVDPISRNGDREKPELAAPGTNITMVDPGPANQRTDSGTSFAAPHVTGTTALLIQKNGRLAIWPEIVRALLMASATHNIEGATRLSDQDGAGGLAADRAAGIVENTAAWNGVRFDCSTPRTPRPDHTERRSAHPPPCRHLVDDGSVVLGLHEQPECGHRPRRSSTPTASSSPVPPVGTTPARSSSSTAGRAAPTPSGLSTTAATSTFLGWAWDTSRI